MPEHAALYDVLPHRHPVLLVDRVTGGEPGTWIETVKALSASEPCYAGLGPGLPASAYAYPPTLVLESFVQSAGALWIPTIRTNGKPKGTLVFGGASAVDFHRSAYPGDTLRHRIRLTGVVGSNAFVTGDTTLLATGETVLTVRSVALSMRPAMTFGGP
jgi:3-hydroxyacyl-[acyl-carrier-protein] dehydratase